MSDQIESTFSPNLTAPGTIESTSLSLPLAEDSKGQTPLPLEQLCTQLCAERDQLREELARVRAERDQYLKSLLHYTGMEFTMTKEQILAECSQNKHTITEVISELESTYLGRP